MQLNRSFLALAAALVVASTSTTTPAAPKKSKANEEAAPKSEREAQIEYAKQLFGEGEAAMENKDYSTAVTKYKEAYRYAPDLHLFTYNIAFAAENAGDCQTARTYYTMFLDLVHEHPQRGAATLSLDKINKDCPYDQESIEKVQPTDRKERAKAREEIEAERALNQALEISRRAAALYDGVASSNSNAQPFRKVAKAKKRHVKRILKLFQSHGVEPHAAAEGEEAGEGDEDVSMPGSLPDACKAAASLEKRSARTYEEVLEHYDTREMYRVMNRLSRLSDNRYRNAFMNSCPKK